MSNKLLNDVAGILAELEVSFDTAEGIATLLNINNILHNEEMDEFIEKASNAPTCGECGG